MKNQIVDRMERYHANVQPLADPATGNALLVKAVGDGTDGAIPIEITNPLNARGNLEVEIASQISPPVIVHAHNLKGSTTLTSDVAVDDKIINVVSVVGAAIGDAVTLTNPTAIKYYTAHIIDIIGLAITLDVRADQLYRADTSYVSFVSHDMNVNGLGTPIEFGLRQAELVNVPIDVDITRIIWTGICDSAVDLTLFGNIPPLLNGMSLRKKLDDGSYQNILNIHDNLDFVSVAYDFDVYEAGVGKQGIDGFACRLTFGGEEKLGTVIRVSPDEDLEIYIQDDLTDLLAFRATFMGAQVADDALPPAYLYNTRVDTDGNTRVDSLGNTRITKETA